MLDAGQRARRFSLAELRSGAGWLDWVVWATLVVCAVYPWYRYPFRLSDAETSPTYSDTPTALQAGKYIVLAPLALAALWYILRHPRTLSFRDWLLLGFAGVATIRAAVLLFDERSVATADVVGPVAAVAPIAVAAGALARSARAATIGRAAYAFAGLLILVHLAANLVQLLLWAASDRVPALGYPGSSVRFGGLWDDPNSTGTLSAAFLVFLVARAGSPWPSGKLILGLAAVANFALAQSFSACVVLVVGICAVLAVRLAARRESWRGRQGLALLGGVGLGAGLLAASIPLLPVVLDLPLLDQIFTGKEESLRSRLEAETWFAVPAGPVEWLVGADDPSKHENAFGSLLAATGLLGVGLLAAWLLASVLSVRGTSLFAWMGPVVAALVVGSMFVPYLTLFPLASLAVFALGVPPSRFERGLAQAPSRSSEEGRRPRRTRSTGGAAQGRLKFL